MQNKFNQMMEYKLHTNPLYLIDFYPIMLTK